MTTVALQHAETRTISLAAPPDVVLDVLSDARRLPEWAPAFAQAVHEDGPYYEIFLLTRMREAFLIDGDARAAVLHGIEKTGNVVTGAALIMTAVFLSFAASTFVTPRQFGIGLAVAVVIDATLLRLLLLPAAMRVLGHLSWWSPAWLDRRLPHLDVEGSRERASNAKDASPVLVPNPTGSVKT